MSTPSSSANSSTVSVWVLANNAGGEPELLNFKIRVTDDEFSNGDHYDMAVARAEADGYATDRTKAFDESDPAGRLMQRMADMESVNKQEQPAGWTPELAAQEGVEVKLWDVPLAVDMSMSARIRVRAQDQEEAIELAQKYAAEEGGRVHFSLDDGNYRGASDFYVTDRGAIEKVDELDGQSGQSVQKPAVPRQR